MKKAAHIGRHNLTNLTFSQLVKDDDIGSTSVPELTVDSTLLTASSTESASTTVIVLISTSPVITFVF